MRTIPFIILFVTLLVGCSSKHGISKREVIDALAKIEGKEQAERSYASWMAEVRPKCPDDETAHRQILESIKRIENMAVGMKKSVDETKDRLLHKTDHQAVLKGSREVMRTRHEFKHDPNWHGPGDPKVSFIAPDDPALPDDIRKLEAASVLAYDDRLRIEFGGGFHHQGFIAYSDAATNAPQAGDGFQRIIEGLWFYEDTR